MFRIGDFSKIAQVSGRLLRYYDEIGLFSPEFTDPQTDYRYYSARQLPQLNRILVLKELGLSLEQIARLLDQHISTDDMRRMLTQRRAEIEQNVQEEVARLRMVHTRLQQLETQGQILEPDVILKTVPAQPFLALRGVLPGMGAIRQLAHSIAATVPALVGPSSLGPIAVVIHSPIFDPEALDVEVGYLLTGDTPQSARLSAEHTLTLRTLPAIATMASLIHIGQPTDIYRSYNALGAWIERNGWQISGAGRHTLIQLQSSDEETDSVVEIQLPITKEAQLSFSI